jgi:acetyltransferase-like isoleucine patch superfamily enzyme
MSIDIGRNCAISWDCEILDTDIHTVVLKDGTCSGPSPVVIEDNVWLGTRSIVLKGVRIGEGAVIGAGSVVTQDIPPHCLAVGNPARPVRSIRGWVK